MNVLDKLISERGLTLPQGPAASSGGYPPGPSLGEMASGGFNHAEQWMNPQQTSNYQGQAPVARPFASQEQDLPPGAPPYAGGPLANPPPKPSPHPTALDPDLLKRFSWSSVFQQNSPSNGY